MRGRHPCPLHTAHPTTHRGVHIRGGAAQCSRPCLEAAGGRPAPGAGTRRAESGAAHRGGVRAGPGGSSPTHPSPHSAASPPPAATPGSARRPGSVCRPAAAASGPAYGRALAASGGCASRTRWSRPRCLRVGGMVRPCCQRLWAGVSCVRRVWLQGPMEPSPLPSCGKREQCTQCLHDGGSRVGRV